MPDDDSSEEESLGQTRQEALSNANKSQSSVKSSGKVDMSAKVSVGGSKPSVIQAAVVKSEAQ